MFQIAFAAVGRVTLFHQISGDDLSAGFKYTGMTATFAKEVQGAELRLGYDGRHPDYRVSGNVPMPSDAPIDVTYSIAHKPHLRQSALKLVTEAKGVTLVAATPFDVNVIRPQRYSPYSLNGAPSLTELSFGRVLQAGKRAIDASFGWHVKESTATLALTTELSGGRAAAGNQ